MKSYEPRILHDASWTKSNNLDMCHPCDRWHSLSVMPVAFEGEVRLALPTARLLHSLVMMIIGTQRIMQNGANQSEALLPRGLQAG